MRNATPGKKSADIEEPQQLSLLLEAGAHDPAPLGSPAITPVVLCGGWSGGLWPMSQRGLPEPYVCLAGAPSLLAQTLARLSQFGPPSRSVLCVTTEEHRFLALDALKNAGIAGRVVLEPQARGTAPAMALAALASPPDALLLFCPASHHIPDTSDLMQTVQRGLAAAQAGVVVCFGVVPHATSAGSFVETGAAHPAGGLRVSKFIHRPAAGKARRLQLQDGVFGHTGVYLARADAVIKALAKHAPGLLQSCQAAMSAAGRGTVPAGEHPLFFVRPHAKHFLDCLPQSFEQAVARAQPQAGADSPLALVPFVGRWSEVTHWGAAAALAQADADVNSARGPGHTIGSKNTFVYATSRPVLTLGTQDLIVVETPEAVLVAHRDHVGQLADSVTQLESTGLVLSTKAQKVHTSWGWHENVNQGELHQVRRVGLKPGASTPLQKHHHRAGHWAVVKGTAQVTRGTHTFLLPENQSACITAGDAYQLHNPGRLELELVEVQTGSYLGEDDVVLVPPGRSRPHLTEEPGTAPPSRGGGSTHKTQATPSSGNASLDLRSSHSP